MNKQRLKLNRRILVMALLIYGALFAVVAKLGQVQLIDSGDMTEKAYGQWTKDYWTQGERGEIYDRDGKVLAENIVSQTVIATPEMIEDKTTFATVFSELLKLDPLEVLNKLDTERSEVILREDLTLDEMQVLMSSDLSGIEIRKKNKRFYPYHEFAAHILGFTNYDGVGQYGLERYYNAYLTGTPGRVMKMTDAGNNNVLFNLDRSIQAEDGRNLITSLDMELQELAEDEAITIAQRTQAKQVQILVMDVNRGEILSAAAFPNYDVNAPTTFLWNPEAPSDLNAEKIEEWNEKPWSEISEEVYQLWRTPYIMDSYEPGSTFKTLVAAAALEEARVNQKEGFYCDGFVRQIRGADIRCWSWEHPHGAESFSDGLANSCNEVFVEVGQRLGVDTFYRYLDQFGLNRLTGVDLRGEQAGIYAKSEDINAVELATMSFGQGFQLTPLQLLTGFNAILNGGYLIEPHLVTKIANNEGKVVESFDPNILRQAVSRETSDELRWMLRKVVEEGTGKRADLKGYQIGGKTGTAQKLINGSYEDGAVIASFIAAAPMDAPKYSVLIIVDEPQGELTGGGSTSGYASSRLLAFLLDKNGYQQTEEWEAVSAPNLIGLTKEEAIETCKKEGLPYRFIGDRELGSFVTAQYPQPGTELDERFYIEIHIEKPEKES
ncbi:stage V sporulation protein D [Gottschalkiaceae bacterium SANA]|nr:stage V sporulation protein D [Gottschalkiaceae bacterium SANA]